MTTRQLIKGEEVRVRALGSGDDWCGGRVVLVSENGVSVFLSIDGIVRAGGGYAVAGVLPLLIDQERGVAEGLEGTEYEIEVRPIQ
jgi:hypothetical protein